MTVALLMLLCCYQKAKALHDGDYSFVRNNIYRGSRAFHKSLACPSHTVLGTSCERATECVNNKQYNGKYYYDVNDWSRADVLIRICLNDLCTVIRTQSMNSSIPSDILSRIPCILVSVYEGIQNRLYQELL
jgi:uncharacterized lipoprotein NlpE involved in copper resistance